MSIPQRAKLSNKLVILAAEIIGYINSVIGFQALIGIDFVSLIKLA
jgi:hypothetical protein